MKRLFTGFVCMFFFTCTYVFSQNVAINTTGAVANPSAMLDVDATNRGLLIPRVALTATNNNAPIGGGVANSLMVYNTATTGAGATAVSPGYYYWDGAQWVRLINTGNAWQTEGNYGTNPAINYAGTADANDFVFRTNAVERMRITTAGNVGIGTAAPTSRLNVVGGGSATVDLIVNGRIQTGDAAGNGGMWLSNASDGFVGNNGGNIGFWTNGAGWNSFQIVKTNGFTGIGTTAPTDLLHVTGNFNLGGSFEPGNLPGTTGQVLTSAGANIPPTWGSATNFLYNNTIHAYSTGGIGTNGAWQVVPGMSVVVTVPAGMTAKIHVHSEVGLLTSGGGTTTISGTDVAIYRNGAFVPNGGYKRVYLGDAFINTDANNTFGNPSVEILEILGAGTYTYDLRCWQQLTGGGTSNAVVGGAAGSVLQGFIVAQVILQ